MAEMRVLRKLSPSELVYDYEHSNRWHIFSNALLFTSNNNLLLSTEHLRKCLTYWCQQNEFLRTKILASTADSNGFCFDRSFALIPISKLDVMRNVEVYDQSEWTSLYEREFNREAPLNYEPDDYSKLLWRLIMVKLNQGAVEKYCMILTIHHGITDGRNAFAIMLQLISILTKSGNSMDENFLNEVSPPLEHYLESGESNLCTDVVGFDDSSSKIPPSFGPIDPECDASGQSGLVTRFESFMVDEFVVKKVLEKCKSKNLKLTGCLNLIYIIATNEAYKKFKSADKIYCYHLMVSLRPHLRKKNSEMGFFASHLDCAFEFDAGLDLDSFDETVFWLKAKTQSDQLHQRLKTNEHLETVKQDSKLIDEIETKKFTNGGGVHFALSNLGSIDTSTEIDSNQVKIDEFYYQVSLEANRWSSLVFNGVSTLNGRLIWGISYNSRFIRTEIIKFIIERIQIVFRKLTYSTSN